MKKIVVQVVIQSCIAIVLTVMLRLNFLMNLYILVIDSKIKIKMIAMLNLSRFTFIRTIQTDR
jgi:hypothetical protein